MKKVAWPLGALGFVAVAITLLAMPSEWEGPVLVPISPGHALSTLDSIAVVPLLIGTSWLYLGLWQRRQRLLAILQRSPYLAGLGIFVAGFGLGLLLASVISTFFWWWAIGAFLFSAVLILASFLVA